MFSPVLLESECLISCCTSLLNVGHHFSNLGIKSFLGLLLHLLELRLPVLLLGFSLEGGRNPERSLIEESVVQRSEFVFRDRTRVSFQFLKRDVSPRVREGRTRVSHVEFKNAAINHDNTSVFESEMHANASVPGNEESMRKA